jgi:hypothetical protein
LFVNNKQFTYVIFLYHINLFDPSRHKKNIISQDLFYSFIHPEELRMYSHFFSSYCYYNNFIAQIFFIILFLTDWSFEWAFSFIHKGSMNMNINKQKKKKKCLVHEHTTGEKSTTLIRRSNIKITHWWDVCMYVC